jgi:hypothetical protein
MLADSTSVWESLEAVARKATAAGIEASIHIVGGAAIELSIGDRGATRDIDALVYQRGTLDAVIAEVGRERGWPDDWLNDKVAMFVSDYVDPHDWPTQRIVGSIVIKVAPLDVLVAMKLRAARGRRDFSDLDLLLDESRWSRTDVERCYDHLYPHDPLNERATRYLNSRFSR